jgi:hypothetical protein
MYLLFIGVVIVIVLLNFYAVDPNLPDKESPNYQNPSTPLPPQMKITREDIDQVKQRAKVFCEGYFNFISASPSSNVELPDDYFHPKFDRKARKEYLKELQAPNRAGIVLVSIQVKEVDIFINESIIGMNEAMLPSVTRLKVEYTRILDNEVFKEERYEEYILFWTRDKNKWKVIRLQPYDPDAIYDY